MRMKFQLPANPVAYIGNCFTLYQEFLQPLQVNYHLLVNYPQRLKQFLVQAKGFAGIWNFISICISLYSFVHIDTLQCSGQHSELPPGRPGFKSHHFHFVFHPTLLIHSIQYFPPLLKQANTVAPSVVLMSNIHILASPKASEKQCIST